MVRGIRIIAIFLFVVSFARSTEEGEELFQVERLLTAEGVEEREPFGLEEVFPADIRRVYCFLEARDIKRDTEVTFVWYAGNTQVSEVTLELREGPRWRTYTYKTIGGVIDEWQIELLDETGNIVGELTFTTE